MKYDEVYKIIGSNIRKYRKTKSWSQEKLAIESKVDRAKISDMENAKEDYLLSTLLQVCEALEITIDMVSQQEEE